MRTGVPERPGRIEFANQLRGLAAVCVALSHLLGVYWIVPGVVSAVTFSPPQDGPPPAALALVAWPWFNFGPFGVALFFLISGLVIPFSFRTHGPGGFVLARLLRIYPTFVAALLLQLAAIYAASRLWGIPFDLRLRTIITNALLVYDLVGEPSLDLVNWTLSVELKFYLLALLLMPALRAGRIRPVLAAAAALLMVNVLLAAGLLGDRAAPPSTPAHTASSQAVCLGYMLLGTAFNLHHRRHLSVPGLAAAVSVLLGAFLLAWRLSVWSDQMPVVSNNYLVALALFAALYAARHRVPAFRPLTLMAALSFPFYLVHSLLGYSALRLLMVRFHLGYGPALALAAALLLAVAGLLHRWIERPTIRMGQRLGHRTRAHASVIETSPELMHERLLSASNKPHPS